MIPQDVDEIIAGLIQREESGEAVDREAALAAHSEHAETLRQFFADRDSVGRLLTPALPTGRMPLPARLRYFGDYELIDEIASGGMGVVYRGRQKTLDRIVAVKMIKSGQLAGDEDIRRFQTEARAAASLRHPNIVSVHEVGVHQGQHYFSMEYVDGQSLAELIRDRPLPARRAARYVRDIAAAVHFAHSQGTLHRDLKPSNVLVDANDEVRITDFGLASRIEGNGELTRTGQILGTPSYIAPEQAQGKRGLIGPASDIYSLGVILYELLIGRPPFRAETAVETIRQVVELEPLPARRLNPSVPRELDTICAKCLEKEPARRFYRTAQGLAEDLERFIRREPILARPIGRPARLWRWCRRNPVVAGLTAATLVLVASVAIISSAGYVREARLREAADNLKARAEKGERDTRSALVQLAASTGNLQQVQGKLDQGKQHLYRTCIRMARSAWAARDPVEAHAYLLQCPPELRRQDWHDLMHVCHPDSVEFVGGGCVAFSGDGKWLATTKADAVLIYDWPSRRLIHELPSQPPPGGHQTACLAFSPDGNLIAFSDGMNVVLWDFKAPPHKTTLYGHSTDVTDVSFSADGRLASASYDRSFENAGRPRPGEIIFWDLDNNKPQHTLAGTGNLAFSPDGRRLATIVPTLEGTRTRYLYYIGVYDLGGSIDEPEFTLSHNYYRPVPLSFGADSESLAAGRLIWNLTSRTVEMRLSKGVNEVVDVSRIGGRVAELSERTAAIWNLKNHEPERLLPWFATDLTDAAFSPDGCWLATATREMVRVWNVTATPDATEVARQDIAALDVGPQDWPQWGGSRHRNNVPHGENVPLSWYIGEIDRDSGELSSQNAKNIKWAARLGSVAYANPVVANGRVLVGTNNAAGYLKRYPPTVDLGVLLCFEEATGRFHWQYSSPKLPTGRAHDWPLQGICSTPVADGSRIWFVTNRCEVICLDAEGFRDGEDDGVEQGVWEDLFTTPFHVHDDLGDSRIPQGLLEKFNECGIALNRNVHAVRLGASDWTLRTWSGSGYVHLYNVVLDDGRLHVYQCTKDGDSGNLLFTLQDQLAPELVAGPLASRIREEFLANRIQLPHEAGLETATEKEQWLLQTGVEEYRLSTAAGYLRVERRVKDFETTEADVIWRFDMMNGLGVLPHNMSNCSVIMADGRLFVCTSNGIDVNHQYVPAPDAPSFIAMDRDTGKVLWTDNSPGENILHAQWASPCYGVFGGQPQVIFPAGDGWLYGFDPAGAAEGKSKLLWKFDCNPKASKWQLTGSTRNSIIAFPAVYEGLIYIAVGEDPEHGDGQGHLWCIDPDGRGDISPELVVDAQGNPVPHRREQALDPSGRERAVANPNSGAVWHYVGGDWTGDGDARDFVERMHRSLSTPAIKDDILYIADFSGLFHCLNAKTGKPYWTYDLLSACWGSALVVDDKVYIADEDGEVSVFRHSSDPMRAMKLKDPDTSKVELLSIDRLQENLLPVNADQAGNVPNMGNSVYATPIVANNVLYISTRSHLFAIAQPEQQAKE